MDPKNPLATLPPQARAEAMDKPYRTSRVPMLIAVVITVIVHLAILANADWLGMPTPEKIAAVGQGAEPKAASAPQTGVVYQNLHAPTSAPPAPTAGPAANAPASP